MTEPTIFNMDPERSMGNLIINGGVIIKAWPEEEARTTVVGNGDVELGAIVRDGEGRWRYDKSLRDAVGIEDDPYFETDKQAGDMLEDHIPSLERVRMMLSPRAARS